MVEDLSADDFKAYFSEDETAVYVVTDSLPRLKLKDELQPEEAPLYMDLETGEGYYPEGVSSSEAADAARYAIDQSSTTTLFHVKKDDEKWRQEFAKIIGHEPDLGEAWSVDLDERDDKSPDYF